MYETQGLNLPKRVVVSLWFAHFVIAVVIHVIAVQYYKILDNIHKFISGAACKTGDADSTCTGDNVIHAHIHSYSNMLICLQLTVVCQRGAPGEPAPWHAAAEVRVERAAAPIRRHSTVAPSVPDLRQRTRPVIRKSASVSTRGLVRKIYIIHENLAL